MPGVSAVRRQRLAAAKMPGPVAAARRCATTDETARNAGHAADRSAEARCPNGKPTPCCRTCGGSRHCAHGKAKDTCATCRGKQVLPARPHSVAVPLVRWPRRERTRQVAVPVPPVRGRHLHTPKLGRPSRRRAVAASSEQCRRRPSGDFLLGGPPPVSLPLVGLLKWGTSRRRRAQAPVQRSSLQYVDDSVPATGGDRLAVSVPLST